MHVERFVKTETNQWLLSEYEGEETTFSLMSIPFEITLADIYDKVDFKAEE
jgi:Uma2 family endonuclease